jgi:hypothetical protein
MSKPKDNTNLLFIFNIRGIICYKFVQPRIVHCTLECLQWHTDLWLDKQLLHHDNVSSHMALSVKQMLPRKKYQCWDIHFAHVSGPLCEFLVPKTKILESVTFGII